MPVRRSSSRLSTLIILAAALTSTGCGQRNAYVPPPPPDVVVTAPVRRSVTLYHFYTGTTQASEDVQVRARVQGYLDSIHFEDGGNVARGQLLFVIDPRPYQAQLDAARAMLAVQHAKVIQTGAVYRRTDVLYQKGAAPAEQLEVDRGNWEVAKATEQQARANVRTAQLNLDFTRVTAPIAGRVSRHLVDVGNLVTADTTLLTTIDRYNPMWVYFTVNERNFLDYLARQRERPPGTLEASQPASPEAAAATILGLAAAPPEGWLPAAVALRQITPRYPVEMGLANETGYPHHGVIDFADNTVDPATGTLQLRATFANPPPYYLAPGLFARIRVPYRVQPDALLIPAQALGVDQAGQYVLVVNKNDVVEHRAVKVGAQEGALRVIESGLKFGERIIGEGLQHARPNAKVQPIPAKG